jgi:hypothetical protein
MKKSSSQPTKQINNLTKEVSKLQAELAMVLKANGVDEYIAVKLHKNQARFERTKRKGEPDTAAGHYLMTLDITAKKQTVYVPLSIASGKKPTGFSYQIEGTGEGMIARADVECRGEGVTQVTLGTIVYAKIPTGKVGTFRIMVTIRGKLGKLYKLFIYRINYKLLVTDVRYQQYLKEIHSKSIKFS